MRLLNITALHHIFRYGLAQTDLELVRYYFGLGEKLKFHEQKLNFLKRCKLNRVFPVFILNGIKVGHDMFNGKESHFVQHHLNIIWKASINYHISQCYNSIRNIKRPLSQEASTTPTY